MKAFVEETSNYEGLSSAPIRFEIAKSTIIVIANDVSSNKGDAIKDLSQAYEVSGKVKAVSLAFDLSIKGEYDKKEKNTTTETTNFAINIHPNTKVSLVVMVEGLLSNGASKFYIFGIPLKKGTWEYIEPVREYYELREEIVYK